jgi:hypothetical protein
MRAQIVQDAIEKAMSHSGKAEGGIKKFQGKVFKNNVYGTISAGDKRQIDLFFNPQEQQMINDIAAVFEARLPQQLVQQGSGPTGAAVDAALNQLGTTGQVAKGAQKLYGYLLNRSTIRQELAPAKKTERVVEKELRNRPD